MKKINCIVCLFIVLFICGVNVYASDSVKVYFSDISEDYNSVVIYSSVDSKDMDLLVSAYNGKNITLIKKIDLQLFTGDNELSIDIDWSNVEKDTIKLFIWNNNMKPYSKCICEAPSRVASGGATLVGGGGSAGGSRPSTSTTIETARGLAMLIGQDSGISSPYILSVARFDGDTVYYELRDRVKYIEENAVLAVGRRVIANMVATTMNNGTYAEVNTNRTYSATSITAENLIFDFSIKNGGISEIRKINNNGDFYGKNNVYNSASMTYGSAKFNESTIVVNLKKKPNGTTKVYSEDVSVGNVTDYFHDGKSYEFSTVGVSNGVASVVVGYNLLEE